MCYENALSSIFSRWLVRTTFGDSLFADCRLFNKTPVVCSLGGRVFESRATVATGLDAPPLLVREVGWIGIPFHTG
jgi:hypothetical protein